MDISIIIVSHNSAKYMQNCIDSIFKYSAPLEKEIIVVDNASVDGSADIVRDSFPGVRLIKNSRNNGFSAANNQGTRIAQGKYILFMNPDTEVQKDSLTKMMSFMDKSADAGAIGPKLLYPDGLLQLSCRRFYTLRYIILRRTFLGKIFQGSKVLVSHLMADWDHKDIREVDWVLAACLMVRREFLEKIGYLDEGYKLYFEDVDLCYRIKEAGRKVYYYPDAAVVHHHQRESAKKFSKKTIWHIGSAVRFFSKFGWKF